MKNEDELLSLEMKISRFLRWGVLVSGAVMLVGWTGTLVRIHAGWAGNPYAIYETYHSSPLVQEIASDFQAGSWPMLLSYLGLAVLIALPMTRVFLTMVLFFKQKEKTLALVASIVLLLLLLSMGLGLEI